MTIAITWKRPSHDWEAPLCLETLEEALRLARGRMKARLRTKTKRTGLGGPEHPEPEPFPGDVEDSRAEGLRFLFGRSFP